MTATSATSNVSHLLEVALDTPFQRWLTVRCYDCSWHHTVHRCEYGHYTAPRTCTRRPDPPRKSATHINIRAPQTNPSRTPHPSSSSPPGRAGSW